MRLVYLGLSILCSWLAVSVALEVWRCPPDHYPLYRPIAWLAVLVAGAIGYLVAVFK